MFATISPITFSASALSKVIASEVFTKYKTFVLGNSGLAIGSYVTTNNTQTI